MRPLSASPRYGTLQIAPTATRAPTAPALESRNVTGGARGGDGGQHSWKARTRMQQLEHRQLPSGAMVVKEGEIGDEFFAVLRGVVSVSVQDKHGVETQVATLREGASFGELALLEEHSRRRATCVCAAECSFAVLHRRAYDECAPPLGLTLPAAQHACAAVCSTSAARAARIRPGLHQLIASATCTAAACSHIQAEHACAAAACSHMQAEHACAAAACAHMQVANACRLIREQNRQVLQDKLALMRQVPVMRDAPEAALRTLMLRAQTREIMPNTVILNQDQEVEDLYIIMQGHIKHIRCAVARHWRV
jgi:CRP-like cAMP-binding protein